MGQEKVSEVTKHIFGLHLLRISMNLPTKIILSLILLSVSLHGCVNGQVIGNRYNFSDVRTNIKASPAKVKMVAITTSDQRAFVISGKCSPAYVGIQRAGFGIPWRVNTGSTEPLADDLTKVVSESLLVRGYKTLPIYHGYSNENNNTLESLRKSKADRILIFVIKHWESDTYINVSLIYDIKLIVYDLNEIKIAEASASETINIPGRFWNPPEAAQRRVPLAFEKVLENLLNHHEVISALQ